MTFDLAGTLDIESSEWDHFVLGCAFDGDTMRTFHDGDDLLDYLRRIGGTWFGHAAGIYDSLYLLERARVRGIPCQVDRSQHRISRIVMGSLQIRDSYAIWPVPLDEICGALGRPVPSLPWPCLCGHECGGYCQIGPRAIEGDPDLEAYCQADTRALYDGLVLLREFAAAHHIDLRGTLGQTAWITAQAELGVPDSTIDWDTWRHVRRGDKGGRIAIVRPLAKGPGAHYDICNAYPAQLAHGELPVGDARVLGGREALLALARERPGIYTLTVKVPEDMFLPPLPWHAGGVLAFPVGTFGGSWTLPEIGHALERGVEIVSAQAAIVFEATAPIFAPLVERWYAIRRDIGRKTPLGQWMGRLPKTLTGKFAEQPFRTRVTMHPDEIKICTHTGLCRDGCTGACGAYEQLDLFGEIWAIPYRRLGPSAYPQWSAYLRAMTRIQWHEQAERFGAELCFGNTDSLWVTGRMIPRPTGSQLGHWERQAIWRDLEIRSAGIYAFRDAALPMADAPLKIRGIPGITEADWQRGSGLVERGVVSFGTAVKSTKGLFHKRLRRWSLPQHERQLYGDRRLALNGITYPLDAKEWRSLVAARAKRR